jgi:citrate synthase
MLTAAEAARRLGVKPQTLYAYVSRGMLTRHPAPDGRRSLFERAEIERLAARSRHGGRAGGLEVIVDTRLTLIDPAGALYYRGQDATRLARETTYEHVAELLWGAETPAAGAWVAAGGGLDVVVPVAAGGGHDAAVAAAAASAFDAATPAVTGGAFDAAVRPASGGARDAATPAVTGGAFDAATPGAPGGGVAVVVPSGTRPADRLRVIVALAAAGDPLRNDLRPEAVRHAARGLIATMVDGLPARSRPVDATIAARLWSRLSDTAPTAAQRRALDAALVLLADHELALAALAARVAASAWANPYLVVLAGLSALGGPLHAGASTAVQRLLATIAGVAEVPAVLGERLGAGETLPGFGHAVYRGRDPRADTLLELIAAAAPARLGIVEEVLRVAGRHGGPAPNVDLALGALADTFGLIPGAAEAIFAVARTAGLIAHALEEYPYRLRFRARAAYVGIVP